MSRNFGLDVMRALSIWLVLLQHGGINIPGMSPLKIGGIGVEIFFVLSGFLIGGILFRELDKGQSAFQTLRSFWIRRWLRILPLYYLVLFFKFTFIDSSIGINILYYIFFLQNNFYGIDYFGVSWSLVIEEWFYIFTPLFLLAASAVVRSEKKLFAVMLGFIVLVVIARIFYVRHGNVPYEGVNGNVPFRFDALFLGVALAYTRHRKWRVFDAAQSPFVFAAGALLFAGYLYYYRTMAFPVNQINVSIFPRTIGFFVLPFSITLMVPFMFGLDPDFRNSKFTRFFYSFITTTSVLTYGIYLIHPFIYALEINMMLSVFLTYLIAWLVYRYFELPILNFRDRIAAPRKELNTK